MTRARALKKIIRARAAKTGERYTTARRHVLAHLHSRTAAVGRPAPPAASSMSTVDTSAGARRPAKSPTRSTVTRGSVSDEKSREKTGKGLDHWFDVLDRFGGVAKGHTASARHLNEVHGVDGWYAQGITVAYERARGVRTLNQRTDGKYEVSVSKVLTAKTADVLKALTEPRLRKRWTSGIDAQLVKALVTALDRPATKGIVVRPGGQARYRYKWEDTTVQLYMEPKPGGKVSFVAANSGLSRVAMVDERRAQWRAALSALATMFSAAR